MENPSQSKGASSPSEGRSAYAVNPPLLETKLVAILALCALRQCVKMHSVKCSSTLDKIPGRSCILLFPKNKSILAKNT